MAEVQQQQQQQEAPPEAAPTSADSHPSEATLLRELTEAIDAVGIEDDWGEEVREGRLRNGCCQNCGTQLFKTKRSRLLLRKVSKPLNIPGRVARGQCLQCINKSNLRTVDVDSDLDAAIALSAMDQLKIIVLVCTLYFH